MKVVNGKSVNPAVEPQMIKAVPILDVLDDDYDWADDTDTFLKTKKAKRQHFDDWDYADLQFS